MSAERTVILKFSGLAGHNAFALEPVEVNECPCCGAAIDTGVPVRHTGCRYPAIGWEGFRSAKEITFECGGSLVTPIKLVG